MLLNKILSSCPGIENIYLLVRNKRGKDVHSRVEEIFEDPVRKMFHYSLEFNNHKIFLDIQINERGLSKIQIFGARCYR